MSNIYALIFLYIYSFPHAVILLVSSEDMDWARTLRKDRKLILLELKTANLKKGEKL